MQKIKELIDQKADVNFRIRNTPSHYGSPYDPADSRTFLHRFVIERNYDMVKFLIENGADVNTFDSLRRSPLQDSIIRKHTKITKLLVENGADVNIVDLCGRPLLYDSIVENDFETAELLINFGAKIDYTLLENRLHKIKDIRILQLFIDKINVNFVNSIGENVLFRCVDPEKIKLFIEHKADVNQKNIIGKTPFEANKFIGKPCGKPDRSRLDNFNRFDSHVSEFFNPEAPENPHELRVAVKVCA